MTTASSAWVALAGTAALAVVARLAGALTTGGAVAGAVVGVAVVGAFGAPGLVVLGSFFVAGTIATRIGWKTKEARGTAEAGEGRRDAKRVLGKGGVAALVAVLYVAIVAGNAFVPGAWHAPFVFYATVAAALADTLGTEIGTLSRSNPRSLPAFESVPVGTPGAVSAAGVLGAVAGAALIAAVAAAASRWPFEPARTSWQMSLEPGEYAAINSPVGYPLTALGCAAVTVIGVAASLVESVAVGLGLRASGFVRNLLTTGTAAAMGCLLWPLRGYLLD